MGMRRYISLTLIGFCLSLLYPSPSKAVHKGAGDITCGSCHTMHSSQGGTNGPNMGGAAGSFILLRAVEVRVAQVEPSPVYSTLTGPRSPAVVQVTFRVSPSVKVRPDASGYDSVSLPLTVKVGEIAGV